MPSETTGIGRDDFDRFFPYLLLAVTISALVPTLGLAIREPIGYDGYGYLLICGSSSWDLFLSRWRDAGQEAHPILHFLALRAIVSFGHSKLLYASASIIPGAVSVYLLGLVAAKLCKNKAAALLAAAAYGFSGTMREIIIDVRAYPLALSFVIAAFYFLVDFIASGARRNRSLMLSGMFTSLAIASEYFSILFLFACLGYLALLSAAHPPFRRSALEWASRNRRAAIAAVGPPFALIAFVYRTNMKDLACKFYPEFCWSPGLSRVDFVLQGLRQDLNYMLPVEISSGAAALAALAAFVPVLLSRGLNRKRSGETLASGVPGLLFLLLLAELIVLSLLRAYPFGSFARQQSILFPFFTLTAFLLLDEAIGSLPASPPFAWLKSGLLALAAAAIAVNFYGAKMEKMDDSERQSWAPGAPREAPAAGASVSSAEPARTTPGKAGIRWARIRGGTFMMGADDAGASAQPRHEVTVKSFEMAKTLVTNKQYRACVEAGACAKTDSYGSWFEEDDQPVVGVDWNQAKAFSEWAGGRLPTEAEWEYAARSGGLERSYPWGNEEATCARAVTFDCGDEHEPTAPVCSKPLGNTRQGLCDMAGNAWEWVQDAFHGSYREAPTDAGAWEDSGSRRVLRGGAWNYVAGLARSEFRLRTAPGSRSYDISFRPAR